MDCPHHLPEQLQSTCAEVARISHLLQDDWWIIGSAAAALLGVEVQVADVDLLVSKRDADALLAEWASPEHKSEGAERFRSSFGCYRDAPMPIEIMGALEVHRRDVWLPVRPTSRVAVRLPQATLFVPDARDQLRLLRLFGRAKDLERAAALIASGLCPLDD